MTTTQTPVDALMRQQFEAWMDSDAPPYWRTTAHAREAWQIWQASARALAAIPAQAATAGAITADEIKLFAHTLEQFEDCNETDTPYETLMKWANRGWLECERFISTAEGNRVLEGIAPPLFAAPESPACGGQVDEIEKLHSFSVDETGNLHGHTENLNVHLLWRDACKEWGEVCGGPDEYEIFANKLIAALRASSPADRQPLTDEQIAQSAHEAYLRGELSWLGFNKDELGFYSVPSLSLCHYQMCRAAIAKFCELNGIVTKEST